MSDGSSWPLTWVNIRIKRVIIILLKLDLGVEPRLSSGHEPGWSLTIDPGQRKNKNSYYHNFKTQLTGWPGTRPKPWVEIVNPSWSKAT
jgi:hypothetical protein